MRQFVAKNQEWKDARYEYRFIMPDGSIIEDPFGLPVRGNEIDKDGNFIPFLRLVLPLEKNPN